MFLGFKSKAERQREIEQGVGKPPSACTVDELKARYEAQQTELIENSKKVYEEVWKHSSLVNAARMVKDEMRKRGVDPSDAGYCEYSEMIEWFGDKVRAFDAEMDRIRQSDKPWGIPNLTDIVREAATHDANSLYALSGVRGTLTDKLEAAPKLIKPSYRTPARRCPAPSLPAGAGLHCRPAGGRAGR